ncbi:MAG: helix-turn-helix domain-containing protein [Phototrophicaceae bacterium]|jgi:transcriptional regulator with XRE-family HTH domain
MLTHLDKSFGQAVRIRRNQLNLSQEELAHITGIHRTYVSQLERGLKSPSLKVISIIAYALQIKAHEPDFRITNSRLLKGMM